MFLILEDAMAFVFVVDHNQFKRPTLRLGGQTIIEHPEGVALSTLSKNKGERVADTLVYTSAQAQNISNKDLSAVTPGQGVCVNGHVYVYHLSAAEEKQLHDLDALKKDLSIVNGNIEALIPPALRTQQKDLENQINTLAKKMKL